VSTSVTDQPKNSRGGTKRESQPAEQRRAQVRVLVASSAPATAAGLEGLLRAHTDLEVIVSWPREAQLEHVLRETDPDILLLEADEYDSANQQTLSFLSRLAGVVPTIVLTASPSAAWMSRALQGRIRGLLPHGISGDELAAALRAVASGLVVLTPELGEVMLGRPAPVESDELDFPFESLTPREQEVLAMVAEGLLNKEIADALHISEHTVKFHLSSIMGKLGASSRTEAVTRGIRRGLVFL
jgi:NarL family two-component system response regulator YdfI